MNLPKDAREIVARFPELSAERKQQIADHLTALPESTANKTVAEFMKAGGPEARFVSALLGQPMPGQHDAPKNKALGSVSTKADGSKKGSK